MVTAVEIHCFKILFSANIKSLIPWPFICKGLADCHVYMYNLLSYVYLVTKMNCMNSFVISCTQHCFWLIFLKFKSRVCINFFSSCSIVRHFSIGTYFYDMYIRSVNWIPSWKPNLLLVNELAIIYQIYSYITLVESHRLPFG